jgi:hypothetical protein
MRIDEPTHGDMDAVLPSELYKVFQVVRDVRPGGEGGVVSRDRM